MSSIGASYFLFQWFSSLTCNTDPNPGKCYGSATLSVSIVGPTFHFGGDRRHDLVDLLVALAEHQNIADDVGQHAGLDQAGEDPNLLAPDVDNLGRVVLEKDADALQRYGKLYLSVISDKNNRYGINFVTLSKLGNQGFRAGLFWGGSGSGNLLSGSGSW